MGAREAIEKCLAKVYRHWARPYQIRWYVPARYCPSFLLSWISGKLDSLF
jgi:hypothetical protein